MSVFLLPDDSQYHAKTSQRVFDYSLNLEEIDRKDYSQVDVLLFCE